MLFPTRRARRIAVGAAFALTVLSSCRPEDGCDPGDEPICEGNTALVCAVENPNEPPGRLNPHVWQRRECSLRCAVENGVLMCQ